MTKPLAHEYVRALISTRTAYAAAQQLGISTRGVARRFARIRLACRASCQVPSQHEIEQICRINDGAPIGGLEARRVFLDVRFQRRRLVIGAPTCTELHRSLTRTQPFVPRRVTRLLVSLPIAAQRVITGTRPALRPTGRDMTSLGGAWRYVEWRLAVYRSVPLVALSLYLAEAVWLYNNRGATDLVERLAGLVNDLEHP